MMLSLDWCCPSLTLDAFVARGQFPLSVHVCDGLLQAFADILSSSETFSAPMDETYKLLDVDPSSITTLESYLQEYYTNIMKKLKQAGAQSRQSDFYV